MQTAEIHELNLTYLMLAQRMLREDLDTAMFQLQVDRHMAELLLSLSSLQLARLAQVNQFLFRLRFDDAGQLAKLTENDRDQGLAKTHAALLLATGTKPSAKS